jgi:DNA-binding CsgD family transcriptional regulator
MTVTGIGSSSRSTGSSSLTEADLRRVLDVVSPEAVADDGPEIPAQVLRGLAELIPCASVTFFVMDTHRGEVAAAQDLVLADLREETDDDTAMFFKAYWDCVACCYPEVTGDHERVTMWTDFYGEREFRNLLMAQYFRGVGFWHELLVTLPPEHGLERRVMLTREYGDVPFSERDRLLLTLLRPHLVGLRDRVEAERRTVPVLTPRQVELLRRVAHGETNRQIARSLGLSEGTVRKHLENIYGRLQVSSRTEALAAVPRALVG